MLPLPRGKRGLPSKGQLMTTANSAIAQNFLAEARQQFEDCHHKVRHCLEQLSDDQAWWRADERLNSIANLVLHLNGNISQRIVSLIGGAPDHRNREQEFAERRKIPKHELLALFDETMRRADEVLASVPEERLLETRRYRMLKGEVEGSVLKLIQQTLAHLAGHTQEIIALTRLQLRERYRFLHTATIP
jgi:hypothetical protein